VKRSARRPWLPRTVLAFGLAATLAGTFLLNLLSQQRDEARFARVVSDVEERIEARMQLYVALLRGAAALFATASTRPADEISAVDFRRYVARLRLDTYYPGVQGLGFSRAIAPEERERFGVWPEHERDEYHSIVFLEPLDLRNQAALGFDMYSEPVRRAAMQKARDTGRPAMSGRVTLVQEITNEEQPGFLIYLPVYRGGVDPGTVEARRTLLEGFVYSPFRAGDLFAGLFGRDDLDVAIEVFDGSGTTPEDLLYASAADRARHDAAWVALREVHVAERTWAVRIHSLPALEVESGRTPVIAFGVGALLMSLALFAGARREVAIRQRLESAEGEARAAGEIRERVLAVLSHDLRNPLGAIALSASTLKRHAELSDRELRLVRRIEAASERMTRMLSQLLDFARIRQGMSLPVEVRKADVHHVCRQVVEELRAANPDQEIQLTLHGEPEAFVDPDRLGQVVSNLTGNAIQHGDGGPVTVRVHEPKDGELAIEVHNGGDPIPEAAISGLFEPFRRVARNGNGRSSSVGLGLFIAKEVVRAHGGKIHVRSPDQSGTTFVVHLPRLPPSGTPG
jgi:two-component system, OmpR family, sensor kinase